MKIIKALATESYCYKTNKPLSPVGIVVHSTGCNNPNLSRYCDNATELGENRYKNFWGTGTYAAQANWGIPHAAIGYDKKKNIAIKTALLDQTIISGLGNIYVDEVLFLAQINPLRIAKNINTEECQKIIDAANKIIPKAIEEGGTTIKSYTSSLGVIGNYQNYLLVHKKEKMPCKNCNTMIKRAKVNGRSTYYCPNCQK